MKSFRLFVAAVLGCACLTSCLEEYDIEIGDSSDYVVIDAMITDTDTMHYVYIRKANELARLPYGMRYNPISDVAVSISDDTGWSAEFENFLLSEQYSSGRYFRLECTSFEPGKEYTLTVKIGDRTFKSTQTMPQKVKVNDLKFYCHTTYDDNLWSPVIYFSDPEPDRDNYYLFTEHLDYLRSDASQHFLYIMPLSDKNFKDNVNGIKISLGMGAAEMDKGTGLGFGYEYYYEMYSINRCNYEYYDYMRKQLDSDGGIYRPNPSTPLTNFSGEHVLGQFIAASKQEFTGRVWIDNVIEE